MVNGESLVLFDKPPDKYVFSDYHRGDVYSRLMAEENEKEISCNVGMASSAAIYILEAGQPQEITISVPLTKNKIDKEAYGDYQTTAQEAWKESLQGVLCITNTR